ncbi:VOC family protein [Frankia sp. AgB1.9]|uniref:VOC family protein n=1 Tax=unclassified Frankia TaxID=2632575 RepID=UPI00193172D3|nr:MULTISPECIES: VOC family protein [unclassified Frankia]MBL7490865.1 VOC family protein [Frankia sp. AgW1.1]MBL7550917.1 VOC family protein [Frankia sp. AgB1.9]MBL7624426.1 VOC family protein [Frankia sp. AgB1.8]
MAEVSTAVANTPAWIDVTTSDVDAAVAFYTTLFGWEARRSPDPAAGGYTELALRGRRVAGAGPAFPGFPNVWMTYLGVADADETARRALAAGGKVLVEPMDVLDAGRLAVLADVEGAPIGLWQPRANSGVELVDEPGALCWTELAVRDADAAVGFYEDVFGWTGERESLGDGVTYVYWSLDGRRFGGLMQMNEVWPPEIPAHWMVYLQVEDADACAAEIARLGGSVPVPPTNIPPGRFAVANDPLGAHFSILQPTTAAP